MKGVTGPYMKEYLVQAAAPNAAGPLTQSQHFETETAAKDFAARTVASNKGGEAVVYKAITVTKLPTPDVEVIDLTK